MFVRFQIMHASNVIIRGISEKFDHNVKCLKLAIVLVIGSRIVSKER